MNLERIIKPAITPIVPKQAITLNIFNQVTVDNAGRTSNTYTTLSNIYAQVELENNQKLQHKHYFNDNTIYKRFYIQSSDLTGLNRNISTSGDYIIMGSLYYKIVEVPENFSVHWVQVIGAESVDEVTG